MVIWQTIGCYYVVISFKICTCFSNPFPYIIIYCYLFSKEEQTSGYKELVRGRIQNELDHLATTCRDMATLLFRLGIPVDGGNFPTSQQVISFSYDIIFGCLLFCPILPMYVPLSIVALMCQYLNNGYFLYEYVYVGSPFSVYTTPKNRFNFMNMMCWDLIPTDVARVSPQMLTCCQYSSPLMQMY